MEIERHRGLPGGRAVVGGVLMAVAAMGVFVAYDRAGQRPTHPVVVAAHAIRMGAVLEPGDLQTIEADLPTAITRHTFAQVDQVHGKIALGAIGEGEIVQAGAITDDASAPGLHEVAINLPRAQVAVGRLKQGERVDVFVSNEDRTTSVVRGAAVVEIDAGGGSTLTSDREITLVVAVPSAAAVAALVHALRTGDVTVVRSTFAAVTTDDTVAYPPDAG